MRGVIVTGLMGALLVLLGSSTAFAERFESENYTIDASVGSSFGGDLASGSYRLTSSGGESIIGNGAGGSYMLDQGYIAQLNHSLQLTAQPKGLVAYYPLDEISGGMASDYSASSHHGQLAEEFTSTTLGKVKQGIATDGSGYVEVPYSTDFDTGSEGFTYSAWINPSSTPESYNIFMGRHFPYFGLSSDGQLHLSLFADGGQRNVLSRGTVSLDQWSYVAATYDSEGHMKVYINGEHERTAGPYLNPANYHENFYIGKRNNSSSFTFRGSIDEVKVYNRALAAAEIKAEYEAGLVGQTAGLVFDGEIIPGVSRTSEAEVIVSTDASSYHLTIQQDGALRSGSQSIPSIAGTINSPLNWSESSTKGLGFTLVSTNATAIPARWGSGQAYAALPGSATSFYNRTGPGGDMKDIIGLRYRLDVASDQPSGEYKNTVTYTGVITP